MLPNHAPLVVAEQFGMLEALHPGRIDLGIGRAPGTDPAHRRRAAPQSPTSLGADDFPEQLGELLGFFDGSLPRGPPVPPHHRRARPGYQPALWMLGSSDYSAHGGRACSACRSRSRTTSRPATPTAALAAYRDVPAVGRARRAVRDARRVRRLRGDRRARELAGRVGPPRVPPAPQGRPSGYPTPEEAAEYQFTPIEREIVAAWTASHVVGDPDAVRERARALVERTGADELMITTMVHGPADRLRSYELLAEVMELAAA